MTRLLAGDPGIHRSTTSPGGTWVLLSPSGQQEMSAGHHRDVPLLQELTHTLRQVGVG